MASRRGISPNQRWVRGGDGLVPAKLCQMRVARGDEAVPAPSRTVGWQADSLCAFSTMVRLLTSAATILQTDSER